MFTLRFPFRLAPNQAIGVDDRMFEISGRQVRFESRNDWYIVKVEGFQSEDEALAYVPHVWAVSTANFSDGLLSPAGQVR